MSQIDLSPQLDIVKQSLYNLGYHEPNGAIISDYNFILADGKSSRVDLLAFGDTQLCDIGTACIAVKEWPNGHDKLLTLKELTYVGSPIALFASPDHVEIWPVRTEFEHTPQQPESLPYEDLPEYFNKHGRELSPRSLLSAKRGERQLSFFDIDSSLIDFARDATQKTLIRQFEAAIDSIPLKVRKNYPKESSRLSIWVLAARILQDKLVAYTELKTTDALTLLKTVHRLWPNYFTTLQEDLSLAGMEAAQKLYDALGGDFTFRSLTNDMLAGFYEDALVDVETRKDLGIYYTPRSLAERILHRLPLEDLRPENRIVLDGTCGSGSLLLAAYDRLSGLLPVKWSAEQRHSYLLNHLWGLDKDSFACNVARLSLLLYDLPTGDGWQIKTGDVFHVSPQQLFGSQPNVIVGNPPFEELRSSTVEKKRVQIAAKIVDLYLDWLAPNGLLGIVLPLTFLHNTSAKNTREKLLKTCDILEIWHLPEGAIPSSSVATAVVLARKLPYVRDSALFLPTRVNEETKNNHPLFNSPLSAMTSYVVPQERWFSNPQRQMVSSPLDHIWSKLDQTFPPVDPKFCKIYNGVQAGKSARPTHFSYRDVGSGWKRVLYDNANGETLEPFAIYWDKQEKKYIKYPSKELLRQRKPEHFEIPSKLIMNATRNPGNPWRFYAAIDQNQLVVTENFHYILPQAATIEELAAVFNSMIANAWFSSRNYHRDITLKDSLKKLPFPTFNEQQKKEIQTLVHKISDMKRSPFFDVKEVSFYMNLLDEIIFDAYRLDNKERDQIREWMSLFPRPGIGQENIVHFPQNGSSYRGRHWTLTGQIKAVDLDRKTVLIWIEGRDNSIEVGIPPTMPGWALRPGVAFQATIPWEQLYPAEFSQVTWLDFQPLDYSYLTMDELISHLSKLGSG